MIHISDTDQHSMYYYMAIFDDEHAILGTEFNIDQKIQDYDQSHRATLTSKTRIAQKEYRRIKKFNPLQWVLYMQGDPMKKMSRGKKNLVARLAKEYSL